MPYNPYSYPGYPHNIQSGTSDITGVSWVSTIDEVKSSHIPFGKQIFMDKNSNLFYVKDYTGSIKAFKFEECELPSTNPENFVTKAEFDQLKEKYEHLVATYSAPAAIQPAQPNADLSANAAVQWNPGASQAAVLQSDCINGNDPITAQQPIG